MRHKTISHLPGEFILALASHEFDLSIGKVVEQMGKTITIENGTVNLY